jgi:replicative DNA helicase
MEETLRLPPNSEEAELCVLGSILIDNDAVLNVSEFLRPEHFYNSNYKLCFEVISIRVICLQITN